MREIEIHNCPEMEEQFKTLKSGEYLKLEISDEKKIIKNGRALEHAVISPQGKLAGKSVTKRKSALPHRITRTSKKYSGKIYDIIKSLYEKS